MSKIFGIQYTVVDEFYFGGKTTYVVVFNNMVDRDGEEYHLEAEYHLDEKRFTFTNVYENEIINAILPSNIKEQIKEYIYKKVGIVKNNLTKITVEVEVTLDVDDVVTIKELNKWKDTIRFDCKDTDKIKVISTKIK